MTTSTEIAVGSGRVLSSIYEWEIDDYFSYSDLKTGEYIRSPLFDAERGSWYLKLHPNGEKEDGTISVFLNLHNFEANIQAQFALSLINTKNEVIETVTTGTDFRLFNKNHPGWGRQKLTKPIVKNDTNKKIKVICEIIMKEAGAYKTILTVSSRRMQHFEPFKKLINNKKFSDVKFTVQSKEIHAHKMVLAASSEVFAAMFEHKMLENEENNVVIEDINYKVFSELLRFMYTGECTFEEDIATELLEAADKYQLLQLKEMCEEELCKNISNKNVMTHLQLADMHGAERLKKEAIDFIALHGKEMIDQPEFESVGNFNVNLLKDIFRGIFMSKN